MKIEPQELRDLKVKTISELRDIDITAYKLEKTDKRLVSYSLELINNPDGHNLYELLALKRFFAFLDKYEFRKSKVKKFIIFYEQLIFSGAKGPTRYKLTAVQVFQFANIYGFYRADGRRLIRDALLFVPRKFSKTTSVASISVEDLVFGDVNAQSYVAANSYDQAKICFDIIRGVLNALDRKGKSFKINRETVWNLRRSSFARCLASDADKLDGLNASTVIVDEYSQADSADLKNVLTSSMGARENPLTVTITTASEKLNGPFVEMLTAYKAILRGEKTNDSIFSHIFEPDIDDREDDPATWRKVQPHMGITVQEDFYQSEYEKALLTSDGMLTFRTKLLNIFVQNENKVWLSQDEISQLARKVDITKVGNYPCMVAVDLSVFDDFSTVTYMMYNTDTKTFLSHNEFYLPEETLEKHPNKELYKKWRDEGYLKIIKGNVIDYRIISNDILAKGRYLTIAKVGYDAYKSAEFVNIMIASGAKGFIEPVKQTYGTFTSPVESLEIVVKLKKITFTYNPIVWYCFGNATLDEDRMGNKKPIKRNANDKIDCTITNLMAFHLINNYTR